MACKLAGQEGLEPPPGAERISLYTGVPKEPWFLPSLAIRPCSIPLSYQPKKWSSDKPQRAHLHLSRNKTQPIEAEGLLSPA